VIPVFSVIAAPKALSPIPSINFCFFFDLTSGRYSLRKSARVSVAWPLIMELILSRASSVVLKG